MVVKRDHNEDSFLCNNDIAAVRRRRRMGGHLGGERASRMAVEIVEREIADVRKAGQFETAARPTRHRARPTDGGVLRKAVVEADRHIYEAALSNPSSRAWGRR